MQVSAVVHTAFSSVSNLPGSTLDGMGWETVPRFPLASQKSLNLLTACVLSCFSCVQLFCKPVIYKPPGSSDHGDSPGKNSGVGCHALLQGIFPIQGLNMSLLHLLHWHAGSLPLAPPGKPPVIPQTSLKKLFSEYLLDPTTIPGTRGITLNKVGTILCHHGR